MDNRNLIIAIALSIAVLIGWQYFVAGPTIDKANQQAAQETSQPATTAPAADGTTPAVPAATAPAEVLTRDVALAQTPRVEIATQRVSGSINLSGGRIDDLRLNEFRETVDPKSPAVTLLSPGKTADGYFAEFGWAAAPGTAVPGPDTKWTAPAGAKLTETTPVTLTYDNGAGLVFSRAIAIDDHYMFTVTDSVANSGTAPVTLSPYGRIVRVGEPKVGGYFILHEGLIGVFDDASLQEVKYKDLKDKPADTFSSSHGWLGITDKYWATALIPESGKHYAASFSRVPEPNLLYQTDFRADPVAVAAGGTASSTSHLFAGAKQVSLLAAYRDALHIDRFDLLIDWGWFWFFTKPMFFLIDWFYRLFGNFGIAILAVTVTVKALFFPLANKSYKSMSAMKKVQPQIVDIRARFKDDKVKQQQAMMELYKKEKINPLAGCWPIAIQIPIFFSLYKSLFVTIEMRHAPFFGWIQDLSAPDPTHLFNLFGLIPWDPPGFLAIGIWPLIMGVTMFLQMRLNPTPPDPTQRIIFTWMPLIFTFMLASFPAGLVIYWAWNNLLSVTQQYVIMRRQGVEVNLWGNIRETFKRSPKPAPVADTKALPKPANDSTPPDTRTAAARAKAKKAQKAKNKPTGAEAKG